MRPWFASGGKQGKEPDDPNILKILDLYTEAAGLKAEGATSTRRRSGRSWSTSSTASARSASPRRSGRAPGVQQDGQHRRPGLQRAALPHAGHSHPETWFFKA